MVGRGLLVGMASDIVGKIQLNDGSLIGSKENTGFVGVGVTLGRGVGIEVGVGVGAKENDKLYPGL